MEFLQLILISIGIVIWLCFSVVILISAVQSFIYERKREKREIEHAERDLEYHNKRMESLK